MNDDYKVQFVTWNECIQLRTKDLIDDCQIDSARSVNSVKYTCFKNSLKMQTCQQ